LVFHASPVPMRLWKSFSL